MMKMKLKSNRTTRGRTRLVLKIIMIFIKIEDSQVALEYSLNAPRAPNMEIAKQKNKNTISAFFINILEGELQFWIDCINKWIIPI